MSTISVMGTDGAWHAYSNAFIYTATGVWKQVSALSVWVYGADGTWHLNGSGSSGSTGSSTGSGTSTGGGTSSGGGGGGTPVTQ